MSKVNNSLNIHRDESPQPEVFCLTENQFNHLKYRMRMSIAQILQIQDLEQYNAVVALNIAFPHYVSRYELLYKSQKDFRSDFDVYHQLRTRSDLEFNTGLAQLSPEQIGQIRYAPQLSLISDYQIDAKKVLMLNLQQSIELSDCAAQAVKSGATVESGVFFHSNTDCDLHSFADGLFVTELAGNESRSNE